MAAADWPVGPARIPALVTGLFAALVMVGLMGSGLPLLLRILLALVTAAYVVAHLYRLLVPRLRALGIDGDRLVMVDRQGKQHAGQLSGRRFASPLYVGFKLRLAPDDRCERIGLFRGQLHPEHFRRLLVRMRGDQVN